MRIPTIYTKRLNQPSLIDNFDWIFRMNFNSTSAKLRASIPCNSFKFKISWNDNVTNLRYSSEFTYKLLSTQQIIVFLPSSSGINGSSNKIKSYLHLEVTMFCLGSILLELS